MSFEILVKKLASKVQSKNRTRYDDMAKELLSHFKAGDEKALSEWLEGFSRNVRHGNEENVVASKNGGQK